MLPACGASKHLAFFQQLRRQVDKKTGKETAAAAAAAAADADADASVKQAPAAPQVPPISAAAAAAASSKQSSSRKKVD